MENVLPYNHPGIQQLIDLVNWHLFWVKVVQHGDIYDCMIWTASKDSSGYGTFGVGSRTLSAHRLGFLHTNSTLPLKGFELHHECLNRNCVNGHHLVVVSHEQNMNLSRSTLDRTASNATRQKAVCKNGHHMTADNTYIDNRGWSECRTCRQENVRRWRRTTSKEVMP